jgi:hypothetical protein
MTGENSGRSLLTPRHNETTATAAYAATARVSQDQGGYDSNVVEVVFAPPPAGALKGNFPRGGLSVFWTTSVGNLPEGYIRNVPLPRVPRDQSTFQSRVPNVQVRTRSQQCELARTNTVHTIPAYYEESHVITMYNSTCRIGERVATANSPRWQPIAINT